MSKSFFHKDYLSIKNTNCLKLIFVAVVVIHHLYQKLSVPQEGVIADMFYSLGYLSVSVFFFLTGYGLFAQYRLKGDSYLKNFFRNRILYLYCICLVLIPVFCLLNFAFGYSLSLNTFVRSFLFGGTVIISGWFLQSILLFYIIFYLAFRFTKTDKYKIPLVFAGLVVYFCICKLMALPDKWFQSCLPFVLGLIWCKYESKIEPILKPFSNACIIATFSLVLFLASLILCRIAEVLYMPIKIFSTLAFVVLVVTVSTRLSFQKTFLSRLGGYYLEIYIAQGICINLFHNKNLYIQNDLLFILCVLVTLPVCAALLHPLFKLISKTVKSKKV
ncbi:MAG: acyltransferase family protein [bacterium]|nr:acyltransferase family protein [bacterium]